MDVYIKWGQLGVVVKDLLYVAYTDSGLVAMVQFSITCIYLTVACDFEQYIHALPSSRTRWNTPVYARIRALKWHIHR